MLIADGGVSLNIRNTMDAILLCKNLNYLTGVKLDVFLSLDDIFVLANSNDLKTFTLSNKKINELNYHDLKKIKFPSHIFNYYIPTLEEVLNNFSYLKILILELHINKDISFYLDKLTKLLNKYPYEYYFIIKDNSINNNKVLKDNEYIYLNNFDNLEELSSDIFIITKYPEKIYKKLLSFDKNS